MKILNQHLMFVYISTFIFSSVLTLSGLIIISIGVGGIKACIGIFGVDQLASDENIVANRVRVFFNTFYLSIYLGLFFGLITAPVIVKIMLYLGYNVDAYAIRFGLPAMMMSIAICKYYNWLKIPTNWKLDLKKKKTKKRHLNEFTINK